MQNRVCRTAGTPDNPSVIGANDISRTYATHFRHKLPISSPASSALIVNCKITEYGRGTLNYQCLPTACQPWTGFPGPRTVAKIRKCLWITCGL